MEIVELNPDCLRTVFDKLLEGEDPLSACKDLGRCLCVSTSWRQSLSEHHKLWLALFTAVDPVEAAAAAAAAPRGQEQLIERGGAFDDVTWTPLPVLSHTSRLHALLRAFKRWQRSHALSCCSASGQRLPPPLRGAVHLAQNEPLQRVLCVD
jgi:hypothetical protein